MIPGYDWRVTRARSAFYIALLIGGVSAGINVRYSWFVPIFTDTAGYVGSGARWFESDLYTPDQFQFLPQFRNFERLGSPLGFRPGAIKGTTVVEYPLGTGVFFAAGRAFGEFGGHVVGPLFAAILAWCAYGLAARLSDYRAGIIAAVLISASPITVRHSLSVNSDVPAAALWTLAWLSSLSPRTAAAAAAGAAVAGAVMIRPVTAPLAVVIGVLVLVGVESPRLSPARWRWSGAVTFGAIALLGPILVLWSNQAQYGNPLDFGYLGASEFFRWANVSANLRSYPASLVKTHSIFAFLGFAAVPIALWREWKGREDATPIVIALSALALIVVNYAIYLPYLNYELWTYLRFVLVGLTALFILSSALTVWAADWLASRSRLLIPVALIPVAVVAWTGTPMIRDALREWKRAESVLMMGHYLREVSPRDAVFLCYVHCGSVAYYTGKPIVRLDLIQPDLDTTIARLQRQRFQPALILDEAIETAERLQLVFGASEYARLDWTPRAAFKGIGRIWYFDVSDRPRHQAGAYYPVDVLPQP